METKTIEIVNRGRGPQLSTTRITVLDVFYWIHRGYGWEQVHQSMPTLTRAEFDVVMEYIDGHREELAEKDRLAEERTERAMAEQHARGGIFAPPENLTTAEWVARFREKIKRKQAEKNGEGYSG